MPVFHTKTIESILEPVAQQVPEYLYDFLRIHAFSNWKIFFVKFVIL